MSAATINVHVDEPEGVSARAVRLEANRLGNGPRSFAAAMIEVHGVEINFLVKREQIREFALRLAVLAAELKQVSDDIEAPTASNEPGR